MSIPTDPDAQPTPATTLEHRAVIVIIDMILSIEDAFPDEASADEILSSVLANLLCDRGPTKPLRWLEMIVDKSFKKFKMMRTEWH